LILSNKLVQKKRKNIEIKQFENGRFLKYPFSRIDKVRQAILSSNHATHGRLTAQIIHDFTIGAITINFEFL